MTKKTKATGRVASDNAKKSLMDFDIVVVSEVEFNKLNKDNPNDYIGLSEVEKNFRKAIISELAIMGMKPDYSAQIMYTCDPIRLRCFTADDESYFCKDRNEYIFILQSGHVLTIPHSSKGGKS